MDSKELAYYLEATDSISKPWLLVQLRLKKLEESRSMVSPEEYASILADIHEDLMNLGEWWQGREEEVF
ncbi:hypothetical protein H6F77_18670 [Microcoleus sp. FACHB-831]|uniref:hypothetical protein n=1 Tax=Microcoleus sp. FACHB-831 TaxID=2692827 RepID=UPI0016824A8C|nr:hypothetical protein [Microcoleus sp. FACHB-831]MBD1923079.1 hypothetical protein [Microcoleus sp. FACHB-831]